MTGEELKEEEARVCAEMKRCKEFVTECIKILKNIKSSEEKKRRFSEFIWNEIDDRYIEWTAEDKKSFIDNQMVLQSKAEAIKIAVDDLLLSQRHVRMTQHNTAPLSPFTIDNGTMERTRKYIYSYVSEITKHSKKKKRGRDDTTEVDLARMFVHSYKQYFGNYPSTGDSKENSDGLTVTPFDKICILISQESKIKIKASHIKKVTKLLKKECG
jgi:hypothetical protein